MALRDHSLVHLTASLVRLKPAHLFQDPMTTPFVGLQGVSYSYLAT